MSLQDEATGTPKLHARWILGALLGLLALGLQYVEVPIFTEETPPFTVWQVPVLVAFAYLGTGPGLVAALIGVLQLDFFTDWQMHPGVALGAYIYVIEAWIAYLIYRRVRSFPLALIIFWASIGWLLDALVYVAWVGLDPNYVVLLALKQLLNAVVYGTAAEIFVSRGTRNRLQRRWRTSGASLPVEGYAFNRIVVVVMLPVTVFGLLYARAQYREVIREEAQLTSETAFDVATRLHQTLDREETFATTLVPRLLGAASVQEQVALLREHVESRPEIRIAGLTNAAGMALVSYPAVDLDGNPIAPLDLSSREYFQTIRRELHTAYSGFLVARLQLESGRPEASAVLAHPVLGPNGEFVGALAIGFDLPGLLRGVLPEGGFGPRQVTLIDGQRRILGSTNVRHTAGISIHEILRGEGGAAPPSPLLADLEVRSSFEYYPATSDQLNSVLGLNLEHAVYQPAERPGWGVLVSLSASAIHARFLSTALTIIGLFLALIVAIVAVVRRFARRMTDPVRSAQRVARLISEGRADHAPVEQMASSDLHEMRDLAASLSIMRDSLQERQRRLEERHEDLQLRLTEAEKLEAIGLLAGGVAHDLNNVLTPILGYSDLGMQIATDDESREFFEEIHESASSAGSLVRELLAFGRRQVLDVEPVDLVDEVRSAPRVLRPLLRENIQLEVLEGPSEARAMVDTAQFHRILFNIALNAQDAMPDGGTLTVGLEVVDRAPGVDPRASPDGFIVVSMSDTGEGIPEDIQAQVLEPFFTTKGDRGTGLGLSTVYGIAQQHGGTIHLESSAGVGTTVRVYLPRTAEPAPARSRAPRPKSVAGRARHVLLVEDDSAVRKMITALLTREGFRVTAFADAETALAEALPMIGEFDCMVTDVVLPGMPGPDLYARINEANGDLPTLFVSGYGHNVLQDQGVPPNVELVMKPFDTSEFLNRLRALLN